MLNLIIDNDVPSSPEKNINKKLDNKRKSNNIDAKICAYNDCKGKKIGSGKFSTLYEHIKYPNLVIKDSKIYNTISKYRHAENIEQHVNFLDEHDVELSKIQMYTHYVSEYYPLNFIKYYEMDHDCVIVNKTERELNNSDDSNDDEYLINQIVLEKVNGVNMNIFKYKSEDTELIFNQLLYIIINLNISGCFHNDIKINNIMIEKRKDIDVLELKSINGEKTGLKKINLIRKEEYFPLVKFVDYSLSYVNNSRELLIPIEIINLLSILDSVLKQNNLSHDIYKNKLEKLCDKIKYETCILSVHRINKQNINELSNISDELLDDIKNIFYL